MQRPIVLKFGGSSVGSPERFRKVVQVIRAKRAEQHAVIVIASALSGVTNKLVELCDDQLSRQQRASMMEWLVSRHLLHAADVLSLRSLRRFEAFLQRFLAESEALIFHPNCGPDGSRKDLLLAIGERLSIFMVSLALEDAGLESCAVDASHLIKTDASFGDAVVNFAATSHRVKTWYQSMAPNQVPVVTGFIGSTTDCCTTTLGRGGSDYSASLIAAAVNALRLERWTDVDGVYDNDPRLDDQAVRFEEIVLEDAVGWNRAGKLGMHRKALDPLVRAKIPVFVRSIDQPDWPGTVIRPKCHKLAATG